MKRRRTGKIYRRASKKIRQRIAKRARAVLKRKRSAVRRRYRSYLTAPEAAKRFGVAVSTIHRWKASGMPYKRIGGVALINVKVAEHFLVYG